MNYIHRLAASAALLAIGATAANAQYDTKSWAKFEDGKLPEDSVTVGKNPAETLKVVELSSIKDMPPEFSNGAAKKELGKHVLQLKAMGPALPGTYLTGIAMSHLIDRDKLGAKSRALFQADFYVPKEKDKWPSLAVLAMDAIPEDKLQSKSIPSAEGGFYRFGMTLQRAVYISCVIPGLEKAKLYAMDEALMEQVPKPGWHRFAIVFDGPETIRCYVDGRETKFSNIKDTSLRKIMVGIMLGEPKQTYDAYMDNLSIQTSDDAPLLPESPYQDGWTVAASQATKPDAQDVKAQAAVKKSTTWLEAVDAWTEAKTRKKPMLLYFYAPGLKATSRMDTIFSEDAAAKAFLASHAAARIDVNQLQGDEIAKKYKVYKVPTLLVISPDAKTARIAVPTSSDDWKKVESQLRL